MVHQKLCSMALGPEESTARLREASRHMK